MSTEQYNFNDWDNEIDINAVSREVMKAQANTGPFEKVPYGTYIVAVDDISLGKSKQDKKQMVVSFVIVEHDTLQGKLITAFFPLEYRDPNGDKAKELKVLGFRIHDAQEFLRSMKTNVEIPKGHHGFGKLHEKIQAIKADINANGWEYQLRFEKNNNYDKFTIEEKFETADQTDDIPF